MKITDQTTEQEIFDTVAAHLLTQNAPSMARYSVGTVCAYRGIDNAKCAVGCLIDDNDYDPDFEERLAGFVLVKLNWPAKFEKLLLELQNVHDLHHVSSWASGLIELAARHDLDSSVVVNFVKRKNKSDSESTT